MKRWPVLTASVAGVIVGFLCVVCVGAAIGLRTYLTTTATVVVIAICPVIYSIRYSWWVVPILNGIPYGGVAFGISKWRSIRKLRAEISK
jgi:hypothetical protein